MLTLLNNSIIILLVVASYQIVFTSKVTMAKEASKNKYSILLPTYNEVENLPIMIWLITKHMDKRYKWIFVNVINNKSILF